ncbi:hypothetical protein CROQUDRAFT_674070 [Cronartium quercuum f. sp. fusiforme G11]|uniref:Uncharacterized protein n=1 Tax=Cronartium quercuum f. sp. fusiforme G11 TaxID=708437 RepID=A0A9P6N8B9_9BASI|nr:hypothetical protein CROQUDRAFT_674070 [Cronartium quercuum f. sp. fusiforme G11]
MDKMDNTSSHHRILLTDKNYFVWEVMVSGELDNINCLDYVLGTEGGMEKNKEKAKKLATLITQYLNEDHLGTIANGKAIWDILKKKSADDNQQAWVMAFMEFDCITFTNINEFTKAVKMAIRQIRSLGFELGSQALAVMFESFVRVITNRDAKLEVDDVIRKLE